MTPEYLSSLKMSYPCGYEYLLGQQQALHNIQLIYPGVPATPAGYSPLAPPSQSPTVPSLLHQGPKVMSSSSPASAPALSSLSSLSSMASVPGVMAAAGPSQAPNKKYRPPHKTDKFTPKPIPPELGNLKTYSNPDILICGNCRELFNDIVDMLEHKRIYCKMRFTCKCDDHEQGKCAPLKSIEFSAPSPTKKGFQDEMTAASRGKKVHLKCSQCKEVFSQAWDLMFHAQNAHGVNIYKLGEKNACGANSSSGVVTSVDK